MFRNGALLIPGCHKHAVLFGFLLFLPTLLSLSWLLIPICSHWSSVPVVTSPPPSTVLRHHHRPFPNPLRPHGASRPCGLEEDMRQYEQDLAKRLYQARVRASQPAASSPAAHLRSEGQMHGIVGVCRLAFSGTAVNFAGANDAFSLGKVLPAPSLCQLAFFILLARPFCFVSFLPASFSFLCLSSLSHPCSSVCSLLVAKCCF